MRAHWWPLVMVATLAAGATLGACSRDFGPTGGSLPLDVNQDSLAVELDPPLAPTRVETVVPDLAEPLESRQTLLLGSHESGSWQATPMLRFDFSDLPEGRDLSVANWTRVELVLQMFKADNANVEAKILRDVELFALADTLRSATIDTPLGASLGPSIKFFGRDDFAAGTRYLLRLASPVNPADPIVQMIDGWIQARDHMGIALVEADFEFSPETEDDPVVVESVVRFASKEISSANYVFLDELGVEAIPSPILKITLADDEADPLLIRTKLDLTHLERTEPATTRIALGSFLPRRPWFEFSLPGAGVPGNATINRAELVLVVDHERSVTVGARVPSAYQSTLVDAALPNRGGADYVRSSATTFVLDLDDELRMDVTEMVQRAVNGLVDADQGILIAVSEEIFDVSFFEFFGTEDPDPDRRPRLEITFTPPADFVE